MTDIRDYTYQEMHDKLIEQRYTGAVYNVTVDARCSHHITGIMESHWFFSDEPARKLYDDLSVHHCMKQLMLALDADSVRVMLNTRSIEAGHGLSNPFADKLICDECLLRSEVEER
ncbi:MAG: hypothetical protein IJ125_04405 [Atopobiaceae bacterium]|nr:hypothetical protein [Atopobiaceae bacterium]